MNVHYNNRHHSMMTAMLAAKTIIEGHEIYDVWNDNEGAKYYESGHPGSKHLNRDQKWLTGLNLL